METVNASIKDILDGEDVATTPADDAKKARRAMAKQKLQNALNETLKKNPEFRSFAASKASSLEVVHALGHGDSGNLIQGANKTKVKDDGTTVRDLVATSAIVGYEVRNIGTEPIPYKTAVCKKGPDGIWTENVVDAVMQPGQSVYLTRQYMTMLTAAPQFSFHLANGKVQKGSGASKDTKSVRAQLESYYFSFNKDTGKYVNDDDVKLNVSAKGDDGKWVVKPEFEEAFGYLNNPTSVAKTRTPKEKNTLDGTTITANYVFTQLLGGGQ